jgi:hypothetical protein
MQYTYEEEKVKGSDGKMETKKYCAMMFKDTAGMYGFRLGVSNSQSFDSIEKYFDTLFGIQKTLRNSFKNAKRQMDAIKSVTSAAKAATAGTLDEEQAAATALMRRRSRPQRWSGDAKEVVSINQPRVHRRIWMSRLML